MSDRLQILLSRLAQVFGRRERVHDVDGSPRSSRDAFAEAHSGAIRVFISSTFRDMQDERDQLQSRTFPELRKQAAATGRSLQEIDLRWGVTREEAESGQVIRICLDEIDACRPHFIAVIGARYGWRDPEAGHVLAGSFPHLAAFGDRSVTELEVRHAILNPPPGASKADAIVYLLDGFERIADSHDLEAISRLVAELRAGGVTVRAYSDPVDLSEKVAADLAEQIGRYPTVEASGLSQRALLSLHAGMIHRPGLLEQLDRLCIRRCHRIVLSGARGSGRSALLAALYRKHVARGSRVALCSLSLAAGHWPTALRGLPVLDLCEGEEQLYERFQALAATFEGSILVDDVDAGAYEPYRRTMAWLPDGPMRATLVVSASNDAVVRRLVDAGYHRIEVPALERQEIERFVGAYFASFGKVLIDEQLRAVASSPGAANPGYLRALCEDLRQGGLFEQLDERIVVACRAIDSVAVLTGILDRVEALPGAREGVARKAIGLLCASRSGLTEVEILGILRIPVRDWAPVRNAIAYLLVDQAGLMVPVGPYLVAALLSRHGVAALEEGRHRLAQFFLRDPMCPRAIDELPMLLTRLGWLDEALRLVSDPAWMCASHKRDPAELHAWVSELAQNNGDAARRVREALVLLSTHADEESAIAALETLGSLGRWDDVAIIAERRSEAVTSDRKGSLLELLAEARLETGRPTAAIETLSRASGLGFTDSLQKVRLWERAGAIALDANQSDIARTLFSKAAAAYTTRGRFAMNDRALAMHAMGLLVGGEITKALKSFIAAESRARREHSLEVLALALGGKGLALLKRGRTLQALSALREEANLWHILGLEDKLARSLSNQAIGHVELDEFDRAQTLFQQALAHASRLGSTRRHVVLNHVAMLHRLGIGSGALARSLLNSLEAPGVSPAAPDPDGGVV